ncbi:MAG: hypothetical protein JWN68_749, partial [Nocardioides sp.]|nr:hypothetical protein [Nocardioides sp.]
QGCSTGVATIPIVVRDVCVVRSVPLSQNTGAGASLLWFMRADRVLHDDDYYIVTTGGDDPGTQ